MRNRVFQMLGIAAKSGNVVSGEFSTEKAVWWRTHGFRWWLSTEWAVWWRAWGWNEKCPPGGPGGHYICVEFSDLLPG